MLEIIKYVLGIITPILSRIIPDQSKLAEVNLEITKALLDSDSKIYESMKDVMVADAGSDSAYVRFARPTIVYWSLGTVSTIIGFAIFDDASLILNALSNVPDSLWQLMTVGTGLFVVGRSGEKMIKKYKGN